MNKLRKVQPKSVQFFQSLFLPFKKVSPGRKKKSYKKNISGLFSQQRRLFFLREKFKSHKVKTESHL